jgi:PAS domain S-box-containing protein
MKDSSKTKQKFIEELSVLKQKIQKLEKVEKALRVSEDNFRRSLDESPMGVRIVTAEGETIYANQAILDFYGYDSIEELKTSPVEKRYTKESFAEYQIRREKRKRGVDSPSEYEISIIRKNGELRHLQVHRKIILWNGEMQYQAIYQDITGRKQAEEELRESEEKYRNLVERATDGIGIAQDGVLCYTNERLAQICGYSVVESIGKFFIDFFAPEEVPKIFDRYKRRMAGEEVTPVYETALKCKDGGRIDVEVNAGIVTYEGKKADLVFIRDISERKKAEEKLQQTLESLRKAVGTTIQVLVSAVESRDSYTSGHQSRSANLACAIATDMGLAQDKIEGIRMAGIIHDIGKLSIPAEILSKPTKLTEIEFALIKEHSRSGYEMLKDVESPWPLAEIVYQHHERMNGSGYPRSLKGDEILIESQILAVADVVEAMASHRPYRPSLGIEAALEEIQKNMGILYDAATADACLRLFREKGYQLT